MTSKYKPTRDRKQRRAHKQSNATRPEELGNIPSTGNAPADPNADIIITLTKTEKEEKRRIELREELKEGQPKMSSKKQKRLNKYIVRFSPLPYAKIQNSDTVIPNRKINSKRRNGWT